MLASVQNEAIGGVTYNEAALLRTQNNMNVDSTKRDSVGGITNGLRSDPDINIDAMNTIGSTHYGAGTHSGAVNS